MTKEQIAQIACNINEILDRARPEIAAIRDMCDSDYICGREAYPLTALVYTAFNTDEQNIPGFVIQKVQYGGKKKLYLPELFCENCLIEVFGSTSDPCKDKAVKQKLRLLGDQFHLLIFTIDKTALNLTKLQIWSFDGFDAEGEIIIRQKETVYQIKMTD